MADGFNEVRAIRLTELIQDFRTLQHEISDITSMPPDVNEEGAGHELLLQCRMEGHALLQQPFQEVPLPTNNDPEEEKRHLQFVVLDAAARRFRAQQILLRAEAARRWISSRDAVLNQQQQGPASPSQMEQVDNALSNALRLPIAAGHTLPESRPHSGRLSRGTYQREDGRAAVIDRASCMAPSWLGAELSSKGSFAGPAWLHEDAPASRRVLDQRTQTLAPSRGSPPVVWAAWEGMRGLITLHERSKRPREDLAVVGRSNGGWRKSRTRPG
ncbi:MAG: hypothetical protein Q9159_004122 [Coniocarpon cinnabarinum]